MAFSFLRNFGISGTSGVLGALSAGIGSLAGDQETDKERQRVRSEREITGFGTGLAEGGQSFASGFKRGFTGLVNKPIQGAAHSGVSGELPQASSSLPQSHLQRAQSLISEVLECQLYDCLWHSCADQLVLFQISVASSD